MTAPFARSSRLSPVVHAPCVHAPFKHDEGYSEDSPTGDALDNIDSMLDQDQDERAVHLLQTRNWLHAQPVADRATIARELLLSLPTSLISDIVRHADQRLLFDPVVCLPQELVLHIFSFLNPRQLLDSARVSKSWNARALHPSLWRRLFANEGWSASKHVTTTFNNMLAQPFSSHKFASRTTSHRHFSAEPAHKRRRESPSAIRNPATSSTLPSPNGWADQFGIIEADEQTSELGRRGANADMDHVMHDISTDAVMLDGVLRSQQAYFDRPIAADSIFEAVIDFARPAQNLIHRLDGCEPQLNWLQVYNQRRRLENNWEHGRYTNFCLPHPDFPDEAHSQCVYTIQFSSTHLVSGGRDKTVRVWDLATRRLKLPPLRGHKRSVLCLQFDDSPDQDIIISGGSDSEVIVWQMSTGQMLRRLSDLHAEPVLNLRFDHRYLVTCSKDHTIKVLNRRDLLPSDPEYPTRHVGVDARYPDYILDKRNSDDFHDSRYFQPLESFSVLMVFDGHKAAVNAIQIHENEIVSASGDRTCMLWDISTGRHVKTFGGHTKGIACVQYDGKRVVSGSSDFTVRVFDRETAAELNLLQGHRELVRTVQAQFADAPGDEEVARQAAREHDRRMLHEQRRRRARQTLAGWTPAPPKQFSLGAMLPPGGGGNQWSKIVSGSYDETVIIWRKDRLGEWFVAKALRQDDALRSAIAAARSAGMVQSGQRGRVAGRPPQGPPVNDPPNMARQAVPLGPMLPIQPPQHPAAPIYATPANVLGMGIPQTRYDPQTHPEQYARMQQVGRDLGHAVGYLSAPALSPVATTLLPQHAHGQAPHFPPPAPHVPVQPPAQHVPLQPPLAGAARPEQQQPGDRDGGGNSRVFKLQFDSRRIICCSQEPVILGWDFANGDRDIIAASRFFSTLR